MTWGSEQKQRNTRIGLKLFGGLTVLIFAGTLAYVVGNRLSDEALGVLAGAVCGVGSTIPLTLLVVVLSRSLNGARREPEPHYTRPMVVPPMAYMPQMQEQQRQPATWNHVSRRDFTVVGE